MQMRSTLMQALAISLAGTTGVHTTAQVEYEIIDLTELAGDIGVVQSEARSINEAGEIVGWELLEDFIQRAIFWDPSGDASFLEKLKGDNSNIAVDIEDDGTVLGFSSEVTFEKQGDIIIIHEDQKAAFWLNGDITNINDLITGGDTFIDLFWAWDRNDAGIIVGYAGLPKGPPFNSNGFLIDDKGVVTDLGNLRRPLAINNNNIIVGYDSDGQDHAMVWEAGVTTDLHSNQFTGVTSRAYDINDKGLIVGEAQFEICCPEIPTLWLDGEPIRLVPELNRPQGIASGVNEQSHIVGFYNDLDDLDTDWFGFLWIDGERTDLGAVIEPAEGWEQLFPWDINEKGQIVGGGIRNGVIGRAFLMTPISTCQADLDGDDIVGTGDLIALLGAWGTDPGGPPDFDGDGNVGTPDLIVLLGAWGECP